mgnify:CR=1 FL=1
MITPDLGVKLEAEAENIARSLGKPYVKDYSETIFNHKIVDKYLFHNLTFFYNEMDKIECSLGR